MGLWWNDTDRGKPKYFKKNLSLCHFSHNKSMWTGLGLNLSLCGVRPVTNHVSHGVCGCPIVYVRDKYVTYT